MSAPTPLVTGVDFLAVSAKDFDATFEFYEKTLGLPVAKKYGKIDGAEFETGNLTLQLLRSEGLGLEFQANNHPIAFHVDDVAAARSELESRGVEFKADTIDSGVCHMAFFEDPDGNSLMLHHRYAPPEALPTEAQ